MTMKKDLQMQASLIAALQASYCVLADQLVAQGSVQAEPLLQSLQQLSVEFRPWNMEAADQIEAQIYQLMSFESFRQK